MKVENPIAERSFAFALQIVELYKLLSAEREYVLSKQLLRSGTSIGANVAEATAAISKRDFAAKMSIASKEARETKYWLMLLSQGRMTQVDMSAALNEVSQLINILTAIVKTAQANME
ncbi:four helix bundle protein [Hymenobacter properus]|uniref:Four helix bundle protein n=1 Tax=Hymenobacter properus TaxID=2791026 RepID=A0A931BKY9_9BACT|nr:four helix bundle protein [Hymenobacter properus]MBF9143336.1 four helix bundle protein [Hymenobacter properus]MBR7722146.1 four helix bundle protein [Microvirga sp. SRT04]